MLGHENIFIAFSNVMSEKLHTRTRAEEKNHSEFICWNTLLYLCEIILFFLKFNFTGLKIKTKKLEAFYKGQVSLLHVNVP